MINKRHYYNIFIIRVNPLGRNIQHVFWIFDSDSLYESKISGRISFPFFNIKYRKTSVC